MSIVLLPGTDGDARSQHEVNDVLSALVCGRFAPLRSMWTMLSPVEILRLGGVNRTWRESVVQHIRVIEATDIDEATLMALGKRYPNVHTLELSNYREIQNIGETLIHFKNLSTFRLFDHYDDETIISISALLIGRLFFIEGNCFSELWCRRYIGAR